MLYGIKRAAFYMPTYVNKADRNRLMGDFAKYLKSTGQNCETTEFFIAPKLKKYQRPDEEVKLLPVLIAEANAGFYDVVFILNNSPMSDWWLYNSLSTEQKEKNDTVARKDEVYHYTDQLIQHVPIEDAVDKFNYWLVPQFKREVDLVHVDLSYRHHTLYSITKDFYKPVEHFAHVSPKVEAWSKALAYTRRQTIAFLMWAAAKRLSEEDLYAYANGVDKHRTGATPDAQIVKCPKCKLPTRASAASVGTVDSEGKYIPEYEGAKQMTCENCGADLSSCFDIDYSIKARGYSFKKQGKTVDIFETVANLTTEIDIEHIDCSKMVTKARARAKVATTPWLVRKNDVPDHTAKPSKVSPEMREKMHKALIAAENEEFMAENKALVSNKQRRIQPLTPEQNARAEKIAKAVKSDTVVNSKRVAPSATIDEIRAMQK